MTNKQTDKHVDGAIRLKPSAAREFILACLRADEPVMEWGDPGIGKTALIGQIAAELYGGENDEEDARAREGKDTSYFRKFILSQREPTDALGLPMVVDGRTTWSRPDVLPNDDGRDGERKEGIFFLDEFPQAVPMLQAPARQLLTERRFGPHELPKGWRVCAAGNYPHNRAGANKLLTHVGSAVVHLHVIPDIDDFFKWGSGSGKIRSEVLAFLKFRPHLLHEFNVDTNTFPCPRTWQKASNLMEAEPPVEVEHALYAGAVGEGAAGELVAFLRVFQSLPDVDEIIRKPLSASVPRLDAVGTLYALAAVLARRATKQNFGSIVSYLGRKEMPVEFAVFALRDAVVRDVRLSEVKEYGQWLMKNQQLLA